MSTFSLLGSFTGVCHRKHTEKTLILSANNPTMQCVTEDTMQSIVLGKWTTSDGPIDSSFKSESLAKIHQVQESQTHPPISPSDPCLLTVHKCLKIYFTVHYMVNGDVYEENWSRECFRRRNQKSLHSKMASFSDEGLYNQCLHYKWGWFKSSVKKSNNPYTIFSISGINRSGGSWKYRADWFSVETLNRNILSESEMLYWFLWGKLHMLQWLLLE